MLTLRELFRLPYRLGRALVKLLDVDVRIPDYTSLQKRAAKLDVVVVDSTGLKAFGDGERRRKKHSVKWRRTYRKLHLAVDPDPHVIVAQLLTESNVHNGDAVDLLLKQIDHEVETLYDDGAYDQWKLRDRLP